jgi:hypothetical protein
MEKYATMINVKSTTFSRARTSKENSINGVTLSLKPKGE